MAWRPGDRYGQFRSIFRLAFKVRGYKFTKNSSLIAFSHCENISCFVALSIVFYMLIRILYYNKGDATYSMLSESEIYIPNLKYCLFKEHRQFEEQESLGLCIIVLLQEKKAEKKWQPQHFMSTAIISMKLWCLVHFPN